MELLTIQKRTHFLKNESDETVPYSQGQPKRRRGNHPVVGDMRKRVAGDKRAEGSSGWCGIVMLIILSGFFAALAGLGYAAYLVLT